MKNKEEEMVKHLHAVLDVLYAENENWLDHEEIQGALNFLRRIGEKYPNDERKFDYSYID